MARKPKTKNSGRQPQKKHKQAGSAAEQDPNYEREKTRYERPIPSREFILNYLSERGSSLDQQTLADELELHEDYEKDALSRRLRAMARDGQLICNRRNQYAPIDKLDLVKGRVIGHPDGFGFLVPDDGGSDLFIGPRQMRSLFHGDRAVMHVVGVDRRGRREGALVEVLERNTHQVVGRFIEEGGIGFVAPENKRISHDIVVPPEERGGAQPDQIVLAQVLEQPSKRARPIGRITEVLGDHMAPGMEIDIAIHSHELPCEWPDAVEAEARQFGAEVPKAAKKGRRDLRETPLVTIDGADARDFDDAVYCQRTPKGWRLLVAIADVSHYVEPGAALDHEARERGNSVYFPERVIPMLPEALSNGLCSLNPEVDRLCMVCEMFINGDGKVVRSRFFDAVMRSHARLIYDDVAAMVVDGDKALRKKYARLVPHLEQLHELYKVLRLAREKRGAIDFETTETSIVFGSERKIERIVPVERNDAHKMIEECMILANVCAAKYLERQRMPALYRVHDRPDEEKIIELREFLGELGLTLGGGDEPQPHHYAKLLNQVQGRPDAHLIQTVLLRSMKQAQYSPDNIGHFGLAQTHYAHFTSPIRRYPDLLVHRAIRHVLTGGDREDFQYDHADMVGHGEHCSMTDRRADEATRDAVAWLKCEYMMDKVGDAFDGIISSVTSFGIFVELSDIFVEGLVHVTNLGNDYFHFDPVGHRMTGERTGTVYRLGDKVQVQVMRVDLDERKIDFELLEKLASSAEQAVREGEPPRGRGKRKKKAKTATKSQKTKKTAGKKQARQSQGNQGKKKTAQSEGKKKTAKKKTGKTASSAPKTKSRASGRRSKKTTTKKQRD